MSKIEDELESLAKQVSEDPTLRVNEKVKELSARMLEEESDEKELGSNDIRTQIGKMKMSQKIKTAMFGDAVARSLLIKDPNKLVQQFVLKNPQLRENELENFANDPNTPKGVLRTIGDTSKWMRDYSMKRALCFNSKCPIDLSMKWFRYLNVADLNKLSKSKSVPNALVVVARKRVAELKKRK